MKKYSTFINAVICLVLASQLVSSQYYAVSADIGGVAYPLTFYGMGAAQVALGRTGVAYTNDASVVYWNPALLSRMEHKQIYLYGANMPEDTRDVFVSGYLLNFLNTNIGMAVYQRSSDGFKVYDENGQRGDTISIYETLYCFSAGKKVDESFSWGISLKVGDIKLYTYNRTMAAVDLGLSKTLFNSRLTLAGVVRNVYAAGELVPPVSLRSGMMYKIFKDLWIITADVEQLYKSVTLDYYAGTEVYLLKPLCLRFGINTGEYSVGIGFKISNFAIDYAYTVHELGGLHKAGVIIGFGRSTKKTVPAVIPVTNIPSQPLLPQLDIGNDITEAITEEEIQAEEDIQEESLLSTDTENDYSDEVISE
ncbi:MAG: hypothetical protein WC955_06310 [Elusimicrobiota bacterium]